MTVRVYRWDDASAPTLAAGTTGSLITVLDAVLVNGYGSKTAAGWTKAFSGTNLAAYQNTEGTGRYFRVEVSRKARKPASQQAVRTPSVSNSKDRKTLFCAVAQNQLSVQVYVDEMTVSIGSQRTLFVHKAEQAQYMKKGSKQ